MYAKGERVIYKRFYLSRGLKQQDEEVQFCRLLPNGKAQIMSKIGTEFKKLRAVSLDRLYSLEDSSSK